MNEYTKTPMKIEKAIRDGIYFLSGILNLQKGINKIRTSPIRSEAIRIGGTESFKTNFVMGKALPCTTAIKSKINICLKGKFLSHGNWVGHRFIRRIIPCSFYSCIFFNRLNTSFFSISTIFNATKWCHR